MGKVTVVVSASELPDVVANTLPGGRIPGMRYRLTVEELSQEARLVALREHVAKGIAQADAGQLLDEDEVFGDLQKEYPNPDI